MASSAANAACWYADDPTAALAADFDCGSPSCIKIEDPAVHVSRLDPGDPPIVATVVAPLVLALACVLCNLPRLCPDTADKFDLEA